MNEQRDLSFSSPPEPPEEVVIPTPVDGQVPTGEVPPVDPDIITIRRSTLQEDIGRLAREDKDFAQVYNRDIGNKAAQRYRPEIDRLTRTVDTLTTAQRRSEYERLTPEQVNDRFKTDPVFAADYAKVVHTPVTPQPVQDDTVVARARIETIMRMGLNGGLTESDITDIQTKIGQGAYDKDITGATVTVEEGLELLQADVLNRIRRPATLSTPAVTPTPPTVVRDTASPDMSNPTSQSNRREQYTMQQVREMPHEEQFKLADRLGGWDKAIADKIILVDGINT